MKNKDIKDWYNSVIPSLDTEGAYEHSRWFKDAIQRTGYEQTKEAITKHVLSYELHDPLRILELGPGAGTWTKLLLKRFPDAYVDLLDISKEMLRRSQQAIGENGHVHYNESDILEWKPEGKYDYFFSSRVLEYIDDKKKFCEKIQSLLEPKGRGFLITKMPHYHRERFLGRRKSDFHQGQIAPAALRDTLKKAGFIDVDCYPVTMVFPLLHSAKANRLLGRVFSKFTLGPIGMLFAESYAVVFRKP